MGHNPWGHKRVSHYLVTEHFPLLSSPSPHMHTREHTGPGEALTSSMESNLCPLLPDIRIGEGNGNPDKKSPNI